MAAAVVGFAGTWSSPAWIVAVDRHVGVKWAVTFVALTGAEAAHYYAKGILRAASIIRFTRTWSGSSPTRVVAVDGHVGVQRAVAGVAAACVESTKFQAGGILWAV